MRNRGGGEKGGMERERVEKGEGGDEEMETRKPESVRERERFIWTDTVKPTFRWGGKGEGGGGWISGAKTWALPRSNDNLRFGERSTATKRLQSVSA